MALVSAPCVSLTVVVSCFFLQGVSDTKFGANFHFKVLAGKSINIPIPGLSYNIPGGGIGAYAIGKVSGAWPGPP